MEMHFSKQDLKRLRVLDVRKLYLLNEELNRGCSSIKGSVMFDEKVMCELVALAEEAAKEVACRNRWSPKTSNGRYSANGITYDTEEYRKWLREMSKKAAYNMKDSMDVLGQFSFCNYFLYLTRA